MSSGSGACECIHAGFNTAFLRSPNYVLKELANLDAQEFSMLKSTLAESKHPRLIKEFSFRGPYGKSKFYMKAVEVADLDKLTRLIGMCGMLLQMKAYLFWDCRSRCVHAHEEPRSLGDWHSRGA